MLLKIISGFKLTVIVQIMLKVVTLVEKKKLLLYVVYIIFVS